MTDDKENDDDIKNFVLRDIYYNENTGFQSQRRTYEAAKKRLSSITPEYVKTWFERQKSTQLKPYRGYNSYIVEQPNIEVAADLADYSRNAIYNRGYAYIFIAVDAFTKYIHAVPIKSKDSNECAKALEEVVESMGNFKTFYTDGEPAFGSKPFIRVLKKYDIHHIVSSSPSGMAERAVGTIKSMIGKRVMGLNLDRERWVDLLPTVLDQYNKQVHSTIEMTPIQAGYVENRAKVVANIKKHAVFNRKYTEIKVGDTVRTYIKKTSFSKQTDPRFSEVTYKVLQIDKGPGGDEYTLNDSKKRRYLRHDLKKIGPIQDKDTLD